MLNGVSILQKVNLAIHIGCLEKHHNKIFIITMKFISAFLLTGLFGFALGGYLPYWSIAIASFIVAAAIPQKPLKALLAGFLGVFFLWSGYSFYINQENGGILAAKVAQLLPLPLGGSINMLIISTGAIGGLIAALGALSGSYLRYKKPLPPKKIKEKEWEEA